ncbi:MAG: hypothetical protein ROR55_03055 [Devosia sp.]
MIRLTDHFSSEHRQHLEWLRRQEWFAKSRRELKAKRKAAEEVSEDIADAASSLIMATPLEITAFERKLDTYDAAAVEALTRNTETLDEVNADIETMLGRAYVMDDGRRVFRTRDGEQVFDEAGTEVGTLDPDLIGPEHPSWEDYAAKIAERGALVEDRERILRFQEQVDHAREEIADGSISADDLERLDAELLALMPPSVAENVPGMAVETNGLLAEAGSPQTPLPKTTPASPQPRR